ncbi:MAG TPA: protein YgfX [Gammaproteobacteria bacterium]|nr:protein YgfX [Gammaproteobacteria bacterium]
MAAWLLLVHAAAALQLPFTTLPMPAMLLIATGILASLAWHWPRQASRAAPGCIHSLTWDGDGTCHLQLQDGAMRRATLCRTAFVQPWLVILHLRTGSRLRRQLVILPDMLDPVTFRRLRVRLRMELGQADASR